MIHVAIMELVGCYLEKPRCLLSCINGGGLKLVKMYSDLHSNTTEISSSNRVLFFIFKPVVVYFFGGSINIYQYAG